MNYLLCFLVGLFVFATVCVAEGSDCLIGVRMIKGSQKDATGASQQLKVGTFLNDIKGQLQPLPFKRFDVLDSKQQRTDYGDAASFGLSSSDTGQHKITVVPHRIEDRRVHLTVNWTNPRGEELLATKLRVANDKCVVLGTDASGGTSTIASIRVNCN